MVFELRSKLSEEDKAYFNGLDLIKRLFSKKDYNELEKKIINYYFKNCKLLNPDKNSVIKLYNFYERTLINNELSALIKTQYSNIPVTSQY